MKEQRMINGHPFISYRKEIYTESETLQRSSDFYEWMNTRRSIREFSDKPVPNKVIENILLSASTAPSGAHKQPWTFCVVNTPSIKTAIRQAAEAEEKESYAKRMGEEWLEDLAPLQTDWQKPFLEIAPFLIVVFRRSYEFTDTGKKKQNYYVTESCGIACGMLLTAIHHAGLAAITHTPSPMNFLTQLLKRPENEKPYLLIPVGYPAKECWVPDLKRKKLEETTVWY
ncbi:MAG: nitroreductase family protein [Chitinophagaceae bacterium]|nr:nitroreductase family protein [Chitinophagaceae bacterium]